MVLDLCSFPVKFWLLLSVLMIDARFLFVHTYQVGSFDENATQFYSAEIILALEHLHQKGIIHRCDRLATVT